MSVIAAAAEGDAAEDAFRALAENMPGLCWLATRPAVCCG